MGCIKFRGKLQVIFNKFVFTLIFSPVLTLKPFFFQLVKKEKKKRWRNLYLPLRKSFQIFPFFFQKISGRSKDDLKYSSCFIKNSPELVMRFGLLRWEDIF